MSRGVILCVLLAGCADEIVRPTQLCLQPSGEIANSQRHDLDGDGRLDWIVVGATALSVFVDVEGCMESRGAIDPEGRVAFINVRESDATPGEMREIVVDTWLMHGDRARRRYVWRGHAYVMSSREPDVIEGRPPR